MISKIEITEFRNRLKLNTKYGNPKIKGTPFVVFTAYNESEKKFYGTHNDSNFQITKNAFLHPTPYIIVGEIKSNKKTKLKLNTTLNLLVLAIIGLNIFLFLLL